MTYIKLIIVSLLSILILILLKNKNKVKIEFKKYSYLNYEIEKSNNFLSVIPLPNNYNLYNSKILINNKTKINIINLDSNNFINKYFSNLLNQYFNKNINNKNINKNYNEQKLFILNKKFLESNFFLDIKINLFKEKILPILNININNNAKYLNEKYSIVCNEKTKSIEINGNKKSLFYAITTLSQIINNSFNSNSNQIELFKFTIIDSPKYSYRGLHLDVARHFFSVDDILKYIDLMSYFKFNKFHWHLTDDQGWRLQSKKYPLLTKIGSYRPYTMLGKDILQQNYKNDNKPHFGYYTLKDVNYIINYAKDRNIDVIPEINIPGHCAALLTAYPKLGCIEKKYKVLTRWRHNDDLFCISKIQNIEFIKNLLNEIINVFPTEYIHLGGDESNLKAYKLCENCSKYMNQNNLDEKELYTQFYNNIYDFLNKKNKKLIIWNDEFNSKLNKNIVLMNWKNETNILSSQKLNYNTINANSKYLYLNFYQTKNFTKEETSFNGIATLKDIYFSKQINNITGIEACLWTEYIKNFNQIQLKILPRILAVSEIAWTYNHLLNYKKFMLRVNNEKIHLKNNNFIFFNN